MEVLSKSTFNEASFKMKRLHDLQDTCNKMRQYPFFIMDRFRQPGFKIHYDCLVSLFQEIASKCTKKEIDGEKDKDNGIKSKLKSLNVLVRSMSTSSTKEQREAIQDGIEECEEEIRRLLDEHGFSTLNMEDLEGDDYN